jgi:hypothetical protein
MDCINIWENNIYKLKVEGVHRKKLFTHSTATKRYKLEYLIDITFVYFIVGIFEYKHFK